MATGVVEAIYKPYNIFFFLSMKKHREKVQNTGKTQGILSWSERGNPAFFYSKLKIAISKYNCKFFFKEMYIIF